MINKKSTSVEEIFLKEIINILERLPGKGENIDFGILKEGIKEAEVCTSLV